VERALAEAMVGRFGYWDALLLASANEAGCAVCFSEDMADGTRLGAVEVIAPFGPGGLSEHALAILDRIG
jgi:predicted nucleic acid-binding protein